MGRSWRPQGPNVGQAQWMDRGSIAQATTQLRLLVLKAEHNHGYLSPKDRARMVRWKAVLDEARAGARTSNAKEVQCSREQSKTSGR